MNVLAALLLSILPHEGAAVTVCDVIETNHYYCENGRLIFIQHVFYDWSPTTERYEVIAWRMVKQPHQTVHRDWCRQIPGQPAGWYVTWMDGDVLRDVRAMSAIETWTQYDREMVERNWLPKECRRELDGRREP